MRVITVGAIGILCLATTVASAQSAGPKPGALPDWSGAWVMQGPTVFDAATVQPKNGRAGEPGVREFPPYNARVRGDLQVAHRARETGHPLPIRSAPAARRTAFRG